MQNIRFGSTSFQLPHPDVCSTPDTRSSTPAHQRFQLPDSPSPVRPRTLQNRVDVLLDAYRQDQLHHESLPEGMSITDAAANIHDPTKVSSHSDNYKSPQSQHPNYEADLSDFERWEQRCNEESFNVEEAVQAESIQADILRRNANLFAQNQFHQNILSIGQNEQLLFDENPPDNYLDSSKQSNSNSPQRVLNQQRPPYVSQSHQQEIESEILSQDRYNQQVFEIQENESQLDDENMPDTSSLERSSQFPEIYSPPLEQSQQRVISQPFETIFFLYYVNSL